MKFFMLDDSSETQQIAPILQPKFGESERSQSSQGNPIDFTQPDSFKDLSLQDIASTAWLGHSNRQGIGNFNAQAFSDKFDENFKRQFKEKNSKLGVEHIYVIGCETALEHKGKSLVQEIANKLGKKGYKKIKVHAIANPPMEGTTAMRVKVVQRAGAAALTGVSVGDVQAYLLTTEQDKELSEAERIIEGEANLRVLQKSRNRSPDQIKTHGNMLNAITDAKKKQNEIESNAIIFLDTSNIKIELDRPENTFTPNQPQEHKKLLSEEQAHMYVVKKIKIQLRVADDNIRGELEILLNNLERGKSVNWRQVLSDHTKEMKKTSNFFSSSVSFTQALQTILDSHPAPLSIQKEKEPLEEKPKKDSSFFHKVKGSIKNMQSSASQSHQSTEKVIVPIPLEMQTAIEQIEAFVRILKEENRNRPHVLKKLFPSAKTVKMEVLEKLAEDMKALYVKSEKTQSLQPQDWIALIDEAEKLDRTKKGKDKGLMVNRLSNRTINLLKNIRDGHAARGILKPVKTKPDEKYEAKAWVPPKKATRRFL
jgi:hypothetical protein